MSVEFLVILAVIGVIGVIILGKVREKTDHAGMILTTIFAVSALGSASAIGIRELIGLFI